MAATIGRGLSRGLMMVYKLGSSQSQPKPASGNIPGICSTIGHLAYDHGPLPSGFFVGW